MQKYEREGEMCMITDMETTINIINLLWVRVRVTYVTLTVAEGGHMTLLSKGKLSVNL